MRWYKCLMAGKNFPQSTDGQDVLAGFYTVTYVEAPSLVTAESQAIRELSNDDRLRFFESTDDRATRTIEVEDIAEIDWDEVPDQKYGLIWYDMEGNDDDDHELT